MSCALIRTEYYRAESRRAATKIQFSLDPPQTVPSGTRAAPARCTTNSVQHFKYAYSKLYNQVIIVTGICRFNKDSVLFQPWVLQVFSEGHTALD